MSIKSSAGEIEVFLCPDAPEIKQSPNWPAKHTEYDECSTSASVATAHSQLGNISGFNAFSPIQNG